MEDQVRRNMEMFQRTFSMFTPFARKAGEAASAGESASSGEAKGDDIDTLKRQMEEMQKRLDKLGGKE